MIELDILQNALAQFENLKTDARAKTFATKVAEQSTDLTTEICKINEDFEKAKAMLIEKRDNAIAEKKAVYKAEADAYADKAVVKIDNLIADLKKIAATLEA